MIRFRTAAQRVAILLIALLIGLLFATSCTTPRKLTYDQWVSQYVTTKVDTTFDTLRLTIPKSRVQVQVPTDTSYVYEQRKVGRATVTLKRTRNTTTADCECDSAGIVKQYAKTIARNQAGVDPKYRDEAEAYRKKAQTRMTWIWALVGIIVVLGIVYLFGHWIQIVKRVR